MINRKNSLMSLVFTILLASLTIAAQKTAPSGFDSDICNNLLVKQILSAEAYGARGFLTSADTKDPNVLAGSMIAGLGEGYFQWFQSVYIVGSKDEMEAKLRQITTKSNGDTDYASAPFIMVTDSTQSDLLALKGRDDVEQDSKKITASFQKMAAKGEVWAPIPQEDGSIKWERVPQKILDRLTGLHIGFNNAEMGAFFSQFAWNDAMFHGAIKFENWLNSGKMKNIKKLRRKLIDQGFRIVFNSHFEEIIERASSMPRDEKPNFISRFTPEEIQAWHILKEKGYAYSAALVNSNNELIAGTFGFIDREKGMINGDSVMYPSSFTLNTSKEGVSQQTQKVVWNSKEFKFELDQYTEAQQAFKEADDNSQSLVFEGGQPDLARVVILSLGERLIRAGVTFFDAGMVTTFTSTVKGEYENRTAWREMVRSAHKAGAPVDFSNDWSIEDQDKAWGTLRGEL